MTLILDDQTPGPGTHALVIGVGTYPHLLDGKGPSAKNAFTLGQLGSPPVSASAFAFWLQGRFNNPVRLKSLDVCLSEPAETVIYEAPDKREHRVRRATKAVVKSAIRNWKARCDGDEKSIALFYYCGHGLASGAELALLLADFGDPSSETTMEHAIDFNALAHVGMEGCRARSQIFLIDACRNEPHELLELDDMGDDKVLEQKKTVTYSEPRNWPIVYATSRDQQAHGRKGHISRFTGALIVALEGAGSEDPTGTWIVTTQKLGAAVTDVLKLGNRRANVKKQLAQVAGNDGGFDLHLLDKPPMVPIAIACAPEGASGRADLRVKHRQGDTTLPSDPEGWQFELEVRPDPYALEVLTPTPVPGGSLIVRPAYRERVIEVRP